GTAEHRGGVIGRDPATRQGQARRPGQNLCLMGGVVSGVSRPPDPSPEELVTSWLNGSPARPRRGGVAPPLPPRFLNPARVLHSLVLVVAEFHAGSIYESF